MMIHVLNTCIKKKKKGPNFGDDDPRIIWLNPWLVDIPRHWFRAAAAQGSLEAQARVRGPGHKLSTAAFVILVWGHEQVTTGTTLEAYMICTVPIYVNVSLLNHDMKMEERLTCCSNCRRCWQTSLGELAAGLLPPPSA